jgi:transcriptional regulator with XRE-family HTH domain
MEITAKEIGLRMKRAREAKNWTQFEFANVAGKSLSSTRVRERIRLAAILGINPHDLVEAESETISVN